MENLNPKQANNQGEKEKVAKLFFFFLSSDSYSFIDVFQTFTI